MNTMDPVFAYAEDPSRKGVGPLRESELLLLWRGLGPGSPGHGAEAGPLVAQLQAHGAGDCRVAAMLPSHTTSRSKI